MTSLLCRFPFPIGDDGIDKGLIICVAMITRIGSGLKLTDCVYVPGSAVFIVAAGRRHLMQYDDTPGSIEPQFTIQKPAGVPTADFASTIYDAVSSNPEAFQVCA